MKIIFEGFSEEKENYYLQQKDIGVMGSKQITVSDEDTIYYVDIKDGSVVNVSMPDGDKQFNIDDVNSQLKSGATIGAALTGERLSERKINKVIKESIRKYILK